MIQQEMAKAAPEQPPEDMEDEDANVAPEEQELYDTVVVTAQSYLFSPGAAKMVVEKLKTQSEEKSLAFAIGHTCAMILTSIKGARAKRGMEPVSQEVMYAAGQEVIADLIQIADRAGLAKEDDAELFKAAAFEAAKVYGEGELKSGEVTPDMQAEAKSDISRVTAPKLQKQGLVSGGMEEKP